MKDLKNWLAVQVFTIYLRYLIGGTFVFSSIVKIQGLRFTTESGADSPINSAWHFFETLYQSGLYWQFLGWGQLVAGLLLMTQRYAKLGAVLFLPIMLNIFVITLSYDFAYTPIITGLMLLGTLYLTLWHWNELKVLVNLKPEPEQYSNFMHDKCWEITGLLLFVFTMVYRVQNLKYDLWVWLGGCLVIGLVAFLVGLGRHFLTLRRLKESNL